MRQYININKEWLFSGTDSNFDVEDLKDQHIYDSFENVSIPHSFNALDGQNGGNNYFRGKCWYIKKLRLPQILDDYQIYIEFEAVNSFAQIYLNGKKLFEHKGGYSRFRVNITDAYVKEQDNILAVCADNTDQTDIYPQQADFTFYGGIYRDVNIVIVPKVHFDLDFYGSSGVFYSSEVHEENAKIEFNARITNPDSADSVQFLVTDANGTVIAEAYEAAQESVHTTVVIPNVHLWQGIIDPYLYTASARLIQNNEIMDEIIDTLGVRNYKIDPQKGFFLNEKYTKLRGVCRHQDILNRGNALSKQDHWNDAYLIKEIGANTIRLAHYQHNQEFYKACDALGFVVWAEIPFITKISENPLGHENCRQQMKELIYQNYNHASICVWGIGNEVTLGGKESKQLYDNLKDLHELVKECDKTRLSTIAEVMMLPMESALNQITDVLSYNHYFGWYTGTYDMNEEWLDKFHAKYPDRALGLSEYGCEGIIKYHSDHPKCKDYSEEYQAEYHEHMAKILDERPYLWATHVWAMFDFGSDLRNEGGIQGRNNKGLITMDRKIKKDAYYIYKAYWSKCPFVYITGRRYADRPSDKIAVKVYSNLPEVTLYVNGKEFNSIKGNKIFVFNDVPLLEEYNSIMAKGKSEGYDNVTFHKVISPNPNYIYGGDAIHTLESGRTWFEDDVKPKTV